MRCDSLVSWYLATAWSFMWMRTGMRCGGKSISLSLRMFRVCARADDELNQPSMGRTKKINKQTKQKQLEFHLILIDM